MLPHPGAMSVTAQNSCGYASKARHPSSTELEAGSETTGEAAYFLASCGVSYASAARPEKRGRIPWHPWASLRSCTLSICSSDRIISINNNSTIKELSHCSHHLLPICSQRGWSSPLYPRGRPLYFYLCLIIRLLDTVINFPAVRLTFPRHTDVSQEEQRGGCASSIWMLQSRLGQSAGACLL